MWTQNVRSWKIVVRLVVGTRQKVNISIFSFSHLKKVKNKIFIKGKQVVIGQFCFQFCLNSKFGKYSFNSTQNKRTNLFVLFLLFPTLISSNQTQLGEGGYRWFLFSFFFSALILHGIFLFSLSLLHAMVWIRVFMNLYDGISRWLKTQLNSWFYHSIFGKVNFV